MEYRPSWNSPQSSATKVCVIGSPRASDSRWRSAHVGRALGPVDEHVIPRRVFRRTRSRHRLVPLVGSLEGRIDIEDDATVVEFPVMDDLAHEELRRVLHGTSIAESELRNRQRASRGHSLVSFLFPRVSREDGQLGPQRTMRHADRRHHRLGDILRVQLVRVVATDPASGASVIKCW